MQSCFYKEYFGIIECLGCGTQRALLLLLEGDIWGSLKMSPPLVLATVVYLVLHLLFRFKKGGVVLKYLGIIQETIEQPIYEEKLPNATLLLVMGILSILMACFCEPIHGREIYVGLRFRILE